MLNAGRRAVLALIALAAGCLSAAPAHAQATRDSVVCPKCVPAKVDTTQVLMSVDTVAIQVRIDSNYAAKIDTTYRDSIIKVPVPGPVFPPGISLVATHTCSSKTENGWTDRGDAAFSIVGGVCQALFKQGVSGGTGPVMVNHTVPRSRVMVVSFRLFVDPAWQGHSSNVNKVLHFWINGGNKVYLSLQGHGAGALYPEVHLQGIASAFCATKCSTSPNLAANLTKRPIQRGRWFVWSLVLTANSGAADGSVTWSIDGVPSGSYSGIRYTASQSTWQTVSWNPTWGGMGDKLGQNQVMDLDDLTVAVGP